MQHYSKQWNVRKWISLEKVPYNSGRKVENFFFFSIWHGSNLEDLFLLLTLTMKAFVQTTDFYTTMYSKINFFQINSQFYYNQIWLRTKELNRIEFCFAVFISKYNYLQIICWFFICHLDNGWRVTITYCYFIYTLDHLMYGNNRCVYANERLEISKFNFLMTSNNNPVTSITQYRFFVVYNPFMKGVGK